METSWANAPGEILYKVLRDFDGDSKTLIQLQLTCKDWYPVAQSIMYETIRLYRNASYNNKNPLLLKTLQLPGRDYASKVKKILFYSYSLSDRDILIKVIRMCPNVRGVENSIRRETEGYFLLLLELHGQGYLRDLERVGSPISPKYPYNDGTIKSYICLMLGLKESIKRLYVPTDRSLALIPALKEFRRLEEINLIESNGVSFAQLDEILRGDHPFLRKVTVKAANLIASEKDMLTPSPNIEAVDLDLKTFSTKELRPILTMFPEVQEINIDASRCSVSFSNVVGDQNYMTRECVKEFFGYLSLRKAFCIYMNSIETGSLISMVHIAAKQLPISSVAIEIQYPSNEGSVFKISTRYERYWEQRATHTKEGRVICHVQIDIPVDQTSENLCRSLLKVLAEDVNPQSIVINDYSDFNSANYQDGVFAHRIDFILTQFKNLKYLELSKMFFAAMEESPTRMARTLQLEKLMIVDCVIPATFFRQLSRKISHIKLLSLNSNCTSSDDLHMPYTSLQTLDLDKKFESCKLSIVLNAASAHVCFDEHGSLRPETHYDKQDVPTYSIRCVALSDLDLLSQHLILKPNDEFIDIFQLKLLVQKHTLSMILKE
ncbi:hypothetical protein FB192DRAFT_1466065 [Mucor lusitanicus]|uniref:F-box domain-containing protein n=2 Tax=Mucor circinelloides f. lusitanicus TaxID=29924 RepID=A0A168J9E8_MUCCL|nr:hypothetical protein FB192DRAFT_1466065 [Mucor lusitanicus]OAD00918.1 hypothetical protein MUCCIDRAFT_164839 [Mucor lusitanicus CBS 277.49]